MIGLKVESIVRRYAPAIGVFALGLLVAAGIPLSRRELPFWAAAALLYGVLLWLLLGRFADEGEELPPVEPAYWAPRILPFALVIPLAAVAWRQTGGNQFRTVGVVCWIAAVAAWVWAWRPERTVRAAPPDPPATVGVIAALVLITALGAFLYLHRLSVTPGEPNSDHAETLLDVTDILNGQRPVFFIRNTGREPWKFYWIVALVKVFGQPVSYDTTKLATAVIGILAIPAVFLLGRELGGNALGLFSAGLVAWSEWPLAQSRVGIRMPYAIFPTAFVLWALLRYLRRGDRASALWAGAGIGVGLYGYIPFRVVPLFVPLVAALALVDPRWRGERRRLLRDVPLMAATAAVVFLPLLRYMSEYPQFFFERMAERSNLSGAFQSGTLSTLVRNLGNMALAFNVRGDGGWSNFVTRDPFLDVATGGLVVAGVLLALSRVFRGSVRWTVPVAGTFILTLPSVLILTLTHENPSVNRAVAAVPVVFVLAAAPLDWLARRLSAFRLPARLPGYAAIAALLAISLRESYRTYFVVYHRQYSHLVEHTMEMAQEVRAWTARGNPRSHAYVLNEAYWLDPRNIGFELGDPDWAVAQEIPPGAPPPLLAKRPLLFLFRPSDDARRDALRRLYPDGREQLVPQTHPDRNFSLYIVP